MALIAAHSLSRLVLPALISRAGAQRRAVIVGTNEIAAQLASRIAGHPFVGVRLLGFFDDRAPDRLVGTSGPRLGRPGEFAEPAEPRATGSATR